MPSTVVLISGANRGIGKGLLSQYLARSGYIVIAAVRNPEHATSKELANLAKGSGTQLVVVKLDVSSDTDALAAVKELKGQGIDHLDIVIANAGVMFAASKVSEAKISDIEGHMIANCYGVVRLYQAVLPLLRQSATPKWITIGSEIGAIGAFDTECRTQDTIGNTEYALSKIAAHWLTKKINGEEESVIAFVMHPGWVQTELGIGGGQLMNADTQPPVTIEASVSGIVKVIDTATKQSHGGRFWIYDGSERSW